MAFAIWMLFHIGSGRKAVTLTAVVIGFWIWFLWSTWTINREVRRLEQSVIDAGGSLEEEPRLKIRLYDPANLAACVLSLVLMVLVFLAYHAGWLAKFGLEHATPTP